jgi:hypothetical protein
VGNVVNRNKLVAVFGWRWEPQWLVDDFIKNIEPIVDDFHVIDNRKQRGDWQDEGAYRRKQRAFARKMGGRWFLLSSPDERFEDRAADVIRDAVNTGPKAPRAVRICEMWTMAQFRIDGQFKYRPRFRLFPVADMFGRVGHRRIHSRIINNGARKRRKLHPHLDVRIYHLKNSVPENRQRRTAVMKRLDQEIGKSRESSWDDFLDEKNVVLQDVPDDRSFSPPYTRPYLWTPET